MKTSQLEILLGEMLDSIEKLITNTDLEDLIGRYQTMITLSGYFFNDDEPNEIIKTLDNMAADISSIKANIQEVIQDNGRELEV